MAGRIHRLTPLSVERQKKPGRYSDGNGLYLYVAPRGSKSWLFMWSRVIETPTADTGENSIKSGKKSKRYEMGLGGFPGLSLAAARKKAQECQELLADGVNPIDERKRNVVKSFGDVADEYIERTKAQWTNDKHEYQWRQSVENYCKPIRGLSVRDIGTEAVLSVLTPIWADKRETATRVRSRIERIIDYSIAKGWRVDANPARWRGHLKNILPGEARQETRHLASMHYDHVPDFVSQLQVREELAARALELTILTAARSGEILKARWDEFDLDNALWVVPAERMKLRRQHRVPLSDRAVELLKGLLETLTSDFVFPGNKRGKPLSNMAMSMLLRRMGEEEITAHGFRSSFRDWAGDCTSFPREIAEAALAHKIGDSTEQAYRRSDALEKRRKLMQAWSDYCLGRKAGKVVQLHG